MDFLDSLLGAELGTTAKMIIAFLIVLLLIAIVAWIARRLIGAPRQRGQRSRGPRIALIESAMVDQKRRLLLVRRDDIEHLILIGGTNDLVVESGIDREGTQSAAQRPTRETPRAEPRMDSAVSNPPSAEPVRMSPSAARTAPAQPSRPTAAAASGPLAPSARSAAPVAVAGAGALAASSLPQTSPEPAASGRALDPRPADLRAVEPRLAEPKPAEPRLTEPRLAERAAESGAGSAPQASQTPPLTAPGPAMSAQETPASSSPPATPEPVSAEAATPAPSSAIGGAAITRSASEQDMEEMAALLEDAFKGPAEPRLEPSGASTEEESRAAAADESALLDALTGKA